MRLQLSTWQEIEQYLQRATGVVIPVGSTEQHGPNGLIGTDAICPETIAHALGEREDILVGPTLSIGMAQHHMGFPGTITLRPGTLIALIRDTVGSLVTHGFTHILFVNGHGGNIATLQTAFADIQTTRSFGGVAGEVQLGLHNWFLGARARRLANELYGAAEGAHATPSEVSLSWYAWPEAVKRVPLEPEVAPAAAGFGDARDFRRRYPDGRMGSNPGLACVEHGRRLLEAGIEDALEAWQQLLRR